MSGYRAWALRFLIFALLASCHQSAHARRYTATEIYVDGRLLLKLAGSDDGSPGKDAVWRYMIGVSAAPEKGQTITPKDGDPDTAELEGKIVIYSPYGGRATLAKLRLVRDKSKPGQWMVPKEEVERALKLRERVPNKPVVRRRR